VFQPYRPMWRWPAERKYAQEFIAKVAADPLEAPQLRPRYYAIPVNTAATAIEPHPTPPLPTGDRRHGMAADEWVAKLQLDVDASRRARGRARVGVAA
jgi:hypothetical protein